MPIMFTDSDDILTELLLRLPVKALIRFKLVSKRWLCLISSYQFFHVHNTRLRLSKPELSLLLRPRLTPHQYYYYHQSNHSNLVQYRFPFDLEDPIICSTSSNGALFLLRCATSPQDCHVYNPSTKQSRRITLCTNERFPLVAGLNIVFDPLKSPYYKIICVRCARRRTFGVFRQVQPRHCEIEVYESDSCTWRICGDPFFDPSFMDFRHGIYWNNRIHWGVFFFDFDKNVVGEVPRIVVPGDDGRSTFDVSYIECNDCLHGIAHYPEKKLVVVFELQKDYSKWLLKHRIDLDSDFGPVSILSMVGGYNEEDRALLIHQRNKIMTYGFEEKSFKVVIDLNEESFYQENSVQFASGFTCDHFFESLALV